MFKEVKEKVDELKIDEKIDKVKDSVEEFIVDMGLDDDIEKAKDKVEDVKDAIDDKIEEKYNLNVQLVAKLEMFNPSGSVKVRPAKSMIIKALKENLDYYYPNQKRRFVFGCLKNKNYSKMMEILFEEDDDIINTKREFINITSKNDNDVKEETTEN